MTLDPNFNKRAAAIKASLLAGRYSPPETPLSEPEAVYPYTDENGAPLYDVARFADKEFRQRHRDEKGQIVYNRGGIEPVPYNLPSVIKADTVFITEGEKDADSVMTAFKLAYPSDFASGRFAATTNTGGAGKWNPAHGKLFKGKNVYVFEDNDDAGRKHTRTVCHSLINHARIVKLIRLPGLKEKGDVSDWLQDHSIQELIRFIKQTKPLRRRKKKATEKNTSTDTIVPKLVCLADVAPRTVDWLWNPYLPMRMLTMISGDPDGGKSYITLSIAAKLTRGRSLDGRRIRPGNVIYMTTENITAEVIRPRFDLLGGDAERLMVMSGALDTENGKELAISLSDVSILDNAIKSCKAKLVIVDPIQSFFGAGVDIHRSNETRPVLDGLARLAEKHNCVILLIRHLNKQSGGRAIHRGLGSIDLTGAARSEMLAGSLPDDPDTRAMVHIKCNVGPKGPSKGYKIYTKDGRFEWLAGPCSITAGQLLAAPSDHKTTREVDLVTAWLKDQLADGAMAVTKLRKESKSAGLSWATVRRAQGKLHIKPQKQGKGPWTWALPQ